MAEPDRTIPRLATRRLLLREWRDADREPFAAMNADPRVMEHFPSRLSRAESDALVDRIVARWDEDGHGLWAVERTADGLFLGFTGLTYPGVSRDISPFPEIGWRFAVVAWGHGYATEAARAAAAWGFDVGSFEQIVSWTTVGNDKSRAVMRRIGMTHDPADDFDHPRIEPGSPLRRHVLYRLRPFDLVPGGGGNALRSTPQRTNGEVPPMAISERAGKPADPATLVDIGALLRAYDEIAPDPSDPAQRVAFGTSGHRGSAFRGAFNEAHILAITEAICRYRALRGYDGPLFIGRDTHALSEPATRTALEVLAAHRVDVRVDAADGFTPTPAVSHAIVVANRGRVVPASNAAATAGRGLADGIVVTPSHNPPDDGGFKYNPPNGGPADTDVTGWIQDEANRLLEGQGGDGVAGIARVPFERARAAARPHDFSATYVADLANVVDMEAIRESGVRIGVDPMGGASVGYWPAIGERFRLDLTVTNDRVDPTFGFMTCDWDGKIRMDPSSPSAMARLIALRDRFDVALGNDADADRHGVVTPSAGLLNPNHFLSAGIAYLYGGARSWGPDVGVGKTLVSSSMIDRVVADLGRRLVEVPVGFKWFVAGLVDGSLGFGGEESAGASFLRRDGSVWTTDKDGIIADLLACELTARTGRDPGVAYAELTERFGSPAYRRIDAPASPEQKAALGRLSPSDVTATTLAGDPITAILTRAPGNDAPIGGLKVVTANGWFAARPSGTENVAKVYAESFRGEDHLGRLLEEAQALVASVTG